MPVAIVRQVQTEKVNKEVQTQLQSSLRQQLQVSSSNSTTVLAAVQKTASLTQSLHCH